VGTGHRVLINTERKAAGKAKAKKKEYLSIFAFEYSLIKKENQLALSIEKGRAVLYSDLVTILRDASMQYITKLSILLGAHEL
jgi:hypothetical protein